MSSAKTRRESGGAVMVTVDSGIKETATLAEVPQSRWRELVDVRRLSLGISLAKDCRRLVEYVDDAEQMYPVLGFSSAAELIRNGLDLKPDEVELAVRWLRLRMPDYPIPYSVAIQRGEEYQKRDARDRQKQRPVGVNQYSKGVYDNKNDVHVRPSGNSTEAVPRRLRKDRLDLQRPGRRGRSFIPAAMPVGLQREVDQSSDRFGARGQVREGSEDARPAQEG